VAFGPTMELNLLVGPNVFNWSDLFQSKETHSVSSS